MHYYKRPVISTAPDGVKTEYESAVAAERAMGARSSNIIACCRKRLKHANGLIWKYGKVTTVSERFWPKVEKTKTCWIWKSAMNPLGYGFFGAHKPSGKYGNRLAHRVAYEMVKGKIPKGLVLDHLCRTPSCVRPSHLEAVTMGVNVLRGNSPIAKWAKMTHCKKGHPYVALKKKHGGAKRWCPPCSRYSAMMREREKRKRIKLNKLQ